MKYSLQKGLIVLVAVILMVMTACSSNSASNPSGNDAGKEPESQTSETSNQAKSDEQQELANKEFDFTYERFSIRPFQPPAENPLEQMIKKDLNVNLRLNIGVGNYNNWVQQFNTRVAANDLPELVFLNKADLIKFAKNGTIIPLDELLDSHPELKSRMNEQQWLLGSVDNKIYGVPNLNPIGPYTMNYIRKDWLDQLKLDMPTTTDELFHVLKAFTFNDPDQNGKNDTFGFTTDDPNFTTMSTLTNAFGLPQFATVEPGTPMDWIDSNGKLHFGPISDEYKQYITYMQELMAAGVVDPDMASNTFAIFKQKMAQGKAGVVPLFLPQTKMFEGNTWLKQIKEVSPTAEWVYLPPIKGPNGHSGNNADSPDASYYIAVTKKVLEEPGKELRAIEIINYIYRDGVNGGPGGQFIDFGQEGVHHKKENGKITEILPQYNVDADAYINVYTMGGLANSHDVLQVRITEEEFKTFGQMNEDRSKGNLIANYYYGALPFTFDGNSYIQEMSLKFIYGKEKLSEWDAFTQTLNERYKYTEVQKLRTQEMQDMGLLK